MLPTNYGTAFLAYIIWDEARKKLYGGLLGDGQMMYFPFVFPLFLAFLQLCIVFIYFIFEKKIEILYSVIFLEQF